MEESQNEILQLLQENWQPTLAQCEEILLPQDPPQADERAVLKHFTWPEKKADALREAAVEYREIKQLYADVSSFIDDASLPCEIILRKIANLVERSERNVQRLIKLRGSAMVAYQDCKIPIDWMLDSGIISMIKQASVRLAKIYLKRVLTELEFTLQIERRSAQESLLSQGVRFAYRVYQASS
ncbi:protein CHUP1, chloroplastic-like [Dendrobium catenatum]|nr:protein CHUP1, chloroplastic-like [Dendrobium catenatum]